MEGMKAPRREPVVDDPRRESQRDELPAGDDPMLVRSKVGDGTIDLDNPDLADFPGPRAGFAPHRDVNPDLAAGAPARSGLSGRRLARGSLHLIAGSGRRLAWHPHLITRVPVAFAPQ